MKLVLFSLIFSSLSMATPRGEVLLNYTQFQHDKKPQKSSSQFVKLQLQDDFKYNSYDFKFDLRARADQDDQSYINLNELNVSFNGPLLETYRIGYFIYNWSRLDSFHPANIINSRYINSDLEDIEKKGELSFVLDNETIFGNVKLFYFPKVELNEYPSSSSRVMDGISPIENYIVDGDLVTKDRSVHQFGLTLQKQIGDFDFTFFAVDHIDRNSTILGYHQYSNIPLFGNVPMGELSTYYSRSLDIGLSSILFISDHTVKLEVVNSNFKNNDRLFLTANGLTSFVDNTIVAIGHEYTYSFESGIDMTFFSEYQYVLTDEEIKQEEINIFENDVFIGHRISFNDFSAKEIKYGLIYDLQRESEWLFFVNYDQRLNDMWKVRIATKVVGHTEKDTRGLYLLKRDNELSLRLTRYF